MSIKWKREHIEKFIFCVQQHSCLYNAKSLEYLDRTLKAQVFNEILAQMQECIPNISVVDLKKKLKNLRTQYMHEQRMVYHSKKSGCIRSEVYVPKLWCYDQLSFLKNHVSIRPSEDDMEASDVPSTSEGIAKQRIVDERCKMSTKWKRQHIEKFICCVQQHSCLYNAKSLEYLDRTLKAQAFNEIVAQMQECIPNISVVDIKKKLKNLRTQFMHEQRMVNHSKKSGCGSSDVYVPKLWCYDQLSFLQNHVAIGPSEDNMEASNVPSTTEGIANERIVDERYGDGVKTTLSDCENTSSSFCENSSLLEKPPRKRAKKVGQIKEFLQKIESFQNSVLSQRKTPNKFQWLGNLVVSQMEEIDPEDQPDAAWEVQCVMRNFTSNAGRKCNTSASSSGSSKNFLELSMNGVCDESDFSCTKMQSSEENSP